MNEFHTDLVSCQIWRGQSLQFLLPPTPVCTRDDLIISTFPAGPHRCYSPNGFKKKLWVPIPKSPPRAIYKMIFNDKKNKDPCLCQHGSCARKTSASISEIRVSTPLENSDFPKIQCSSFPQRCPSDFGENPSMWTGRPKATLKCQQ